MENIDWKNLPFAYSKTDFNVRCYFKNGKWGEIEVSDSEFLSLHMASTSLHYGQQAFEGLKAYRGKDGKIRLFRWNENARRMLRSASGILMPEVPVQLFKEAVFKVVKLNNKFVPTYGFGATLYIRPLLIGSGPEVGVKPSKEYLFLIFVSPVGPYFKDGFSPVDIMICREYDRAAPLGTGSLKVGGNYAASLLSIKKAHESGFSTSLYLDAKEKKYIDEAFEQNWIAPLGPNVDEFENTMARYCGVKDAAALSSGTAAIHLALIMLGVQAGEQLSMVRSTPEERQYVNRNRVLQRETNGGNRSFV